MVLSAWTCGICQNHICMGKRTKHPTTEMCLGYIAPHVIACDFDGTLDVNAWPEIGYPNFMLIDKLIRFRRDGGKVILWTCREGALLDKAVEWCRTRGLEFDALNDNLEELKILYNDNCRKVSADLYLDDKSCDIWKEWI